DATLRRRRAPQRRDRLAQVRFVAAREGLAAGTARLDPRELRSQERGLQIGEVRLVAQLDDIPVTVGLAVSLGRGARHPGAAQPAQPLRQVAPPRGDRAAVAARDVLGGVEREDGGVAELAGPDAVALHLHSVCGVLDDDETAIVSDA